MTLHRKRAIAGFLPLVFLVMLAACGNEPENTPPRSESSASGSFTFFNIGKNTRISGPERNKLENLLGDAAVERRGIVNLEISRGALLQGHFPELERMNRQLNSEIGLRVKHHITRLMYRNAKQKGLPYDLVEFIFSEQTTQPLLIRLHFKTEHAAALQALQKKYGPARTIEWGPEKASSQVWKKEGDYLFYSVIPVRGYQVEYRIDIYFTAAIEALIQAEKAEKDSQASRRTGF
jgi:hypothetical protein